MSKAPSAPQAGNKKLEYAGDRILILDFGSQFTQLIARRIREQSVYCEILPAGMSCADIEAWGASGIVLSGGPSSVHDEGAPDIDIAVFDLGTPILGICYGEQLIVSKLGGRVEKADESEYGRAHLKLEDLEDRLFAGLAKDTEHVVWMSHGDKVL
ncbi:MAG: GMP synthase (glutamine-hydrolyzing), partial [Myxococcota bacterium]